MRKNKGRSKDKEVHKMEDNITVDNFSLAEFIKANSAKIRSITPLNPTIKKDDEWRDEDFWDELYRKKRMTI